VRLDIDYQNLQGNFEQANVVYGTDHYPFDNATSNQGFHNVVTTPPYVENPPTGLPPVTVANPKAYAFEQYAALGVLQYSRGPTNAVPTPLTSKHSASTAITVTQSINVNILDFTGIARAICRAYVMDTTDNSFSTKTTADVYWTGAGFYILQSQTNPGTLGFTSSGNILQIRASTTGTVNNVYWTIEFVRIQ
jgi:hypothetical protein